MTPTEERELLELAAKACGFEYSCYRDGYLYGFDYVPWSTLHNSGDCFDAIEKLGPQVFIFRREKEICVYTFDRFDKPIKAGAIFDKESERLAATRLAVTRALAEIGRAMR